MTREIKFRAWDGEGMSAPFTFDDIVFEHLVKEKGWSSEKIYPKLKEGSYHLLQFTGLKDKNGKEIYEGDILESSTFDKIRSVVKENDIYSGQGDNDDETVVGGWVIDNYYNQPIESFEIIGNIYQNPELLK